MSLFFRITTDILKAIPAYLLLVVGTLAIAIIAIDCGFSVMDMFREVMK